MKKRIKILAVLLSAALSALILLGSCGEQKTDVSKELISAPSVESEGKQTVAPSEGEADRSGSAESQGRTESSSAESQDRTESSSAESQGRTESSSAESQGEADRSSNAESQGRTESGDNSTSKEPVTVMTKSSSYKEDGTPGDFTEYKYDSHGNKIKTIDYYPSLGFIRPHTYEYDATNRLIKEMFGTALPLRTENWGLSLGKEGQKPTGNATMEELAKYGAYFCGAGEEKVLYLTFDCGYENGNTELILDALKKHDAPATFFVVGHFLKSAPEIVKRIVEAGHTVGNHTYHHPDMSQISDKASFQKELDDVETLFHEITGTDLATYYRPPQGKYGVVNLQMAQELGYNTFFWSIAYVDWDQNAQPSHENAMKTLTRRVHPGAIVLLHIVSKTNGEILDELLTKWEEMGYTFRPLSDLVEGTDTDGRNKDKETSTLGSGDIDGYDTYEYNSSGLLAKYSHFSGDGSPSEWRTNEYDGSRNLLKVSWLIGDEVMGWWEYAYDASGNQTRYKYYCGDGTIETWREHEYDASGNETKEIIYKPDGEISYWVEFSYNDAGSLTKRVSNWPDGRILGRDEYEYDSSGNLKKITNYNSDGSVRRVEEYITIIPE